MLLEKNAYSMKQKALAAGLGGLTGASAGAAIGSKDGKLSRKGAIAGGILGAGAGLKLNKLRRNVKAGEIKGERLSNAIDKAIFRDEVNSFHR